MAHIIIKNFGPLSEADVYLKRINIIIGPQSQGKSTLLKIASYCSWVEKRIELTQSEAYFQSDNNFAAGLVVFHKMQNYIRKGSFVSYESEYMCFSYDFDSQKFTFSWKDKRWEYRRPKISYIPSERNIVAAIPNWFEVSMERNNIRNFMTDWENARKATVNSLPILNLDIAYHYDSSKKKDEVVVGDNNTSVDFTNTSSGLQSLIPLFVLLNYLYSTQYESEKAKRISGDWFLGSDGIRELCDQRQKRCNLIAEYDSATVAAKAVGSNRTSIRNCANGKQKHAGGYIWRYL